VTALSTPTSLPASPTPSTKSAPNSNARTSTNSTKANAPTTAVKKAFASMESANVTKASSGSSARNRFASRTATGMASACQTTPASVTRVGRASGATNLHATRSVPAREASATKGCVSAPRTGRARTVSSARVPTCVRAMGNVKMESASVCPTGQALTVPRSSVSRIATTTATATATTTASVRITSKGNSANRWTVTATEASASRTPATTRPFATALRGRQVPGVTSGSAETIATGGGYVSMGPATAMTATKESTANCTSATSTAGTEAPVKTRSVPASQVMWEISARKVYVKTIAIYKALVWTANVNASPLSMVKVVNSSNVRPSAPSTGSVSSNLKMCSCASVRMGGRVKIVQQK